MKIHAMYPAEKFRNMIPADRSLTDEMIDAGISVLQLWTDQTNGTASDRKMVYEIFLAMQSRQREMAKSNRR